MLNIVEFKLNITMDPHFLRVNLESIPENCTKLIVTGKFLKNDSFSGKSEMVGDTNLSSYRLNERLKSLKALQILDFSECTEIKKIHGGFSNLSVKTIVLPPYISEMPNIYYCPNLTTIIGKGLKQIRNIIGCPTLEYIEFNYKLDYICIPNTKVRKLSLPNVLEIDCNAFQNCSNLVEIEFSPMLKKIGSGAFENCTSLYSVSLPNTCSELAQNAFKNCSSLKHLSLSENLFVIRQNAFANCVELLNVTGGKNISVLEKGAFHNCPKISILPFAPEVVDIEAFDLASLKRYGIIMSTYQYAVIWCFDTLSFYYYPEIIEDSLKYKIVSFNSPSRCHTIKTEFELFVERNECQLASNLEIITDFGSLPYEYREAVSKLSRISSRIPNVVDINYSMLEKVRKLDISKIIQSYNTYASESQTWKVGGDNTFHHFVKTTIDYSDCYIESLLPNINEEYHESACHDYAEEIDLDLQSKYSSSDAKLKLEAMQKYSQEEHVKALVDDFIKSYISDKELIEDTLHVYFAQSVKKYFFRYIYKDYKRNLSLSILCNEESPSLDYKKWLRTRADEILKNREK